MDHLEQMTWKERIQYAIDKGDDLTIGEWEWMRQEARKGGREGNKVWWRVENLHWQAALTALERIED